ncbi:unnamed protein product [Nezara viridula]|uniref:Uncharacterized protein n=1 Tax=Nezara viridula TaxID=85310 RepID=A0A9P0H517_NEZVI|nr:unnamed protein product [Nezara viridula]
MALASVRCEVWLSDLSVGGTRGPAIMAVTDLHKFYSELAVWAQQVANATVGRLATCQGMHAARQIPLQISAAASS